MPVLLNSQTERKYEALKKYINKLDNAAVALSGGVDSSLLAKVCFDVLGDRSIAITIVSPMLSKKELVDAQRVASVIGIRHILLPEKEIESEVRQNPVNRCYFCKKIEFGLVIEEAKRYGVKQVLDGSNADDISDYRPGAKAAKELQVKSPLQVVGLTKNEIRELSRMFSLPTSNKPAFACLASRIPYGEEITGEKLERIEKAEVFLQSLGFCEMRVRSHDTIARIEVAPTEREKLFDTELMDRVSQKLKSYGFLYVCMELEGYSLGSLNRKVKK
ncbi:MAG: ATP-dependent sacrificial sulfur transferase LarE [Bacteroidales bacterium]|nr:ATP-dependent sacrificial sulfur transferase LarE [Bacteroidales bacterium]